MSASNWRLANLPLSAKIMLTAFLALLGCGYFFAIGNIYEKHHEADLEPGLTIDDLRRTYHGLEKTVTEENQTRLPSTMERVVAPGGIMRMYLELGGEPAVRALTTWLDRGSPEADFATPGAYHEGDPSVQMVIANQCVECHNPEGDMYDVPYAPTPDAEPTYELVAAKAAPVLGPIETEANVMQLAPTGRAELIHITHAHILSMPVFTLCVGVLFLLTGLPDKFKLLVGPLPMVALCLDIGSWWLARPFEPAIHLIAAAGAIFGITYGIQILCAFASLWFGRRTA